MITILPLEINGWKAPMHSTYVFERKKVYSVSPERSLSGQLKFGEKIFIPYFSVSWAHMTIDNFTKLMTLSENDETIVKYFDTFSNVYTSANFAIQQPSYDKLHALKCDNDGVLGLKLVFDGTLNDITRITVGYNINNSSASGLVPASINGWIGQEFKLSLGTGLTASTTKIDSWNSQANGGGTKYLLGGAIALANSLTLYAQWIPNNTFSLSYDYSVGTVAKASDNSPLLNKECLYNEAIGLLPPTVPHTITYEGKEIIEPYNLRGWFALPNGEGTEYLPTTKYNVLANITIHAHFKPQEFTLTFISNGGNYTPSALTQGYKSAIYPPYAPEKVGFKFGGWFKDNLFNKAFNFGTMPPESLTIYAKWERVSL